jgi:hypothetical protein
VHESGSGTNAKCSDVRYLVAIRGETDVARTSRFCRCGGHTRQDANNWRGTSEKKQHFVPAHNPRTLMCYCVRNLYVTIRATMLAKISSAARDFRIIGPVELRAADEAG